jgi:hypothetical protein
MNGMPTALKADEPIGQRDEVPASRRQLYRLARLSVLTQAGLLLLVGGLLIDLIGPLFGGSHASHHAAEAHVGHLVAMAGMVAVLAGVVIDGIRQHQRAAWRRSN